MFPLKPEQNAEDDLQHNNAAGNPDRMQAVLRSPPTPGSVYP